LASFYFTDISLNQCLLVDFTLIYLEVLGTEGVEGLLGGLFPLPFPEELPVVLGPFSGL
jgi:hypothetical protein